MNWFSFQMITIARLGQAEARSLELDLCLPQAWAGTRALEPTSAASPGALAGSWVGDGAARTLTGALMGVLLSSAVVYPAAL